MPTQPTWLAAITNGHCATWKRLTAAGVHRHFPESVESWQGHGRKVRSGLRLTKKLIEMEQDGKVTTKIEPKTNTIFRKTYDLSDDLERKMYTDQTGKFPVRSVYIFLSKSSDISYVWLKIVLVFGSILVVTFPSCSLSINFFVNLSPERIFPPWNCQDSTGSGKCLCTPTAVRPFHVAQ